MYEDSQRAQSAYGARPLAQVSSQLLTQAFFWMFAGLLLTAFIAFLVENNFSLARSAAQVWIILILAEMDRQRLDAAADRWRPSLWDRS